VKDKIRIPKWMSREDAANVLGVSKSTVDNYRREGLFKSIVLAGKRRRLISTESVIELIATSPSEASNANRK